MLTFLLLVAIVWLLWTIHQDLLELADRQRGLKTGLERVASRIESLGEKLNTATPAAEPEELKIPINSASKTQLRRLPKVGAVIADRIIAARPFSSIDELGKLEGVTPQMLEGFRQHASLD